MDFSLMITWAQFLGITIAIGFSGYFLSLHGDRIAELTGLGRNLVGLMLLSVITSLPELMAGISSIRIAQNPDLAVGDILGSCLFNLSLIFILDLLYRKSSAFTKANSGHALSAGLGMILISFVGLGILLSQSAMSFSIGHVGIYAAAIPLIYIFVMRKIYRHEMSQAEVNQEPRALSTAERLALKKSIGIFTLSASVVVACGLMIPIVADQIVIQMGWNSAFVGTLFMAFATSLPEIAVTFSAIRIHAVEMAFGNILGSNLFNIVILTFDDIAYTQGVLFQSVSNAHVITAVTAVMMTSLIITGIVSPPTKRVLGTTSWLSLILVAVYLFNALVIFKLGHP